jgi:hypothetical protein
MYNKLLKILLNFFTDIFVFLTRIIHIGLDLVKKVLTFFIGIMLISFILFNRFFRERIPHKIPMVVSIHSYAFLIYFVIFLICGLVFVLFVVLIVKPSLFKTSKSTVKVNKDGSVEMSDIDFAKQTLNDISNLVKKSLRYVHLLFGDQIPNYLRIILYFSTKFGKLRPYYPQLICIFVYVPYLLVPLVFVIDIIYFNKFNYFYNTLYVLIFPLIFNTLIGIFRQTYDLHAETLTELAFIYVDPEQSQTLYNGITYEKDINDSFQVSSVEEFQKVFVYPAILMEYAIFDPIDKFMAYYGSYIAAATFFMYSVGWGYIAFHGFF